MTMTNKRALLSSPLVAAFAAATLTVRAMAPQGAPATEVFLAPLAGAGAALRVGPWTNISNSPGYDNQPSFLPDASAVLFSSQRDGTQMDIYRYDLAGKQVVQVTKTAESEYSPAVTPDRRSFSVIRVEADGAQRLWRFDLDGSNPRLVLAQIKPVGYHAWIDATHLAVFILGSGGSPATLQLADTATGTAEVIDTGIGRSILIRPGRGTVSYMKTQPRMMMEMDARGSATAELVAPVEGSQDAAWLPDGRLLMARGATISAWTPGTPAWVEFANLVTPPAGSPAVGAITRMAVSPDGRWLAFVAEPRAQ
jgi:hypothetical protein